MSARSASKKKTSPKKASKKAKQKKTAKKKTAAKKKKKTAAKKKKKTAAKKKKKTAAKKKKKTAAKKKKTAAKKKKVLFVPDLPERRKRQGLGEWVQDWPCAGARSSRVHYAAQPLKPPLSVRWRTSIHRSNRLAPVVTQDGLCYVADREGSLFALDSESGRVTLHLRTDPIREDSPAWPLVTQGLVDARQVPVSSPPVVVGWQLLFGDDEGIFYCIRRGDGVDSWRKVAPLSMAGREQRAYQAPLCEDGVVYTADADGNLYGVDPRTGQRVLSLYMRGRPTAPMACAQRRMLLVATKPIFSGESSKLHAVGLDGTRIWHRDLPARPNQILGVGKDSIVVGGAFGLRAYETTKGVLRWSADPGGALVGNAVLDRKQVYVASAETVYALDQLTGQEVWSAPTNLRGPVVGLTGAASVLWAAAGKSLIAWRTKDGAELGQVRLPGDAVAEPVLALGRMYVATQGDVLALDPA